MYTRILKGINKADFIRYITIKRFLSENSIRHCNVRFEVLKSWMIANKRDFDKFGIEAFIAYLLFGRNLKPNSINAYYFLLYQLELYCLDRGIYTEPFLEEFRRPRRTQPHTIILTPEEIERIFYAKRQYYDRNGVSNEGLEFFYKSFIMFLALTGCRFAEATSLKVKNIDFDQDKAIFEITKTRATREVFFTEPLKSYLIKLTENKNKDDLVFSYTANKRLSQQTFAAELKKRAEIVGIKKRVYPHLFRHSFATQLLISGVELTYVSSLLGHSRIQTTYESYIHLADTRRRQAMFSHPLIRKGLNTKAIINSIKNNLQYFRLDSDDRFNYVITEQNGKLAFTLEAKG